MKDYDIYFMDKMIRYKADHELFYVTLTGQSVWMESVMAATVEDAFRVARQNHIEKCVLPGRSGVVRSVVARTPQYMYTEAGDRKKYVPYSKAG